ncbi:MAG: LPS assembly protein LptD [Alphaproteobacteria bacterium]|nr:LPS assembly protein LptD [Alphaproteobacteria bacterium]
MITELKASVLLTADEVIHDPQTNITIAKGHVEISKDNKILLADEVIYDETAETIVAKKNISLLDTNGNVVFTDKLEIKDDLKEATIQNIRILLADRSRIAAARGYIRPDSKSAFDYAVYSPCLPCKDNPNRAPLWQAKAVRVIHDAKTHRITYKNSWIEMFGVPVFYTPYFSHPDGTQKKQTGLLAPTFFSNSTVGVAMSQPLFINLAPEADVTLTPIIATKKKPVLGMEYRQHFGSGKVRLGGSATISSRVDSDGDDGDDDDEDKEHNVFRGHIDAEGDFDINDYWRAGFNINRATDKSYVRTYKFSNERTLTSNIFAEGFHKRNYALIDAEAYQGTRDIDDNKEQAFILPSLSYNFVGEPRKHGDYLTLDTNFMSVNRIEGRESRRLSTVVGWNLPYVGSIGDLYSLRASLQTDAYIVNDVDPHSDDPDPDGHTKDGFTGRIFPRIDFEWRYPFMSYYGNGIFQTIEPILAFALAPNYGNPGKLPNEDSQDIIFDETNVFLPDRFTGTDRVDEGQRVSYGFKWSLYKENGGLLSFFLGQSYQPTHSDFPDNSGLSKDLTDTVGRILLSPSKYLNFLYRFQLDSGDYSPTRHEVALNVGAPLLNVKANYLFYQDVDPNSDEFDEQEEVSGVISSKLTDFWHTSIFSNYDVDSSHLNYYGGSIDYEDECFALALSATRSYFDDEETDKDLRIVFRLSFKNLGEIGQTF